jgi:hypothetical protein
MRLKRKELLQRLLMVQPGIAKRENSGIVQGSCVILKRGRFYSFNQEVSCSLQSGLPAEWEGAIYAAKLEEILDKLPDEEIDVDMDAKAFTLKGKSARKVRLPFEEEQDNAYDLVERPKDWILLEPDWFEAVSLAVECTNKRGPLLNACIHISPSALEASDNVRAIRYRIKTFITQNVLVRGETVDAVSPFGMNKGCETQNWLHFRNPMGLRISVRKWESTEYPDLAEIMKVRGQKIVFKPGIVDVARRAGMFAAETGAIQLKIDKETMLVVGSSVEGEYEERSSVKWNGEAINVWVAPKMLMELVKTTNTCEVTPTTLRVKGERFTYVVGLEVGS